MRPEEIDIEVRKFLSTQHGNFIDGRAITGHGKAISVTNPADGQELCHLFTATPQQAEEAMISSARAFGLWRDVPPLQRGELILKLADKLEQDRELLAHIESLCSGKTLHLARVLEIDQSVAFLRYFAGWAGKITGETIDVSLPSFNQEKYTAWTRRQPLGVVVGIIPWNFSIMIAVWKLAAALVCGCTIVLKPSEYTPLTLLRIAELAGECGFPPGVINVVNGLGADIGRILIEHPLCAKISFTGSVPTGRVIGATAQRLGKKVTLELGGKNAALFLNDMTAEEIVDGIIESGYLNQGQICAAAECFWLPENKSQQIYLLLIQRLSAIKIGDPLVSSTEMGPLANSVQLKKLINLVELSQREGDEILYGGSAIGTEGYFFQPTAIKVRSSESSLMKEEAFGPVCSFISYTDEEEAVRRINASPYGLSASIWTHNVSKAIRYSEQLEVGIVWINMHTFLDPALPFGGTKGSGIGREFGSAFIHDYTELKSVMMRY